MKLNEVKFIGRLVRDAEIKMSQKSGKIIFVVNKNKGGNNGRL